MRRIKSNEIQKMYRFARSDDLYAADSQYSQIHVLNKIPFSCWVGVTLIPSHFFFRCFFRLRIFKFHFQTSLLLGSQEINSHESVTLNSEESSRDFIARPSFYYRRRK